MTIETPKSPTWGWIAINAFFLSLTVLGFVQGWTWAAVLFCAAVGLMILTFAVILASPTGIEEMAKQVRNKGKLRSAPRSLDIGYDVMMCSILLLSASWVALVVYLAFILLQNTAITRVENHLAQSA